MPQIEVSEQELQKVDELVKNGVFHSRESAVKGILESLSELSLDEIKRMEKAKQEADMFLMIYRGDMLYTLTPSKVIIGRKELYKLPVKSATYENSPIFGYVYVDPRTLQVDVDLSTGFEALPETSKEELEILKKVHAVADTYCENNFVDICAGAPRRLDLEDEEEFEVVVKGKFKDKTWICGYLFLDVNTLTVKQAAIDRKRIEKLKAGENVNEGSVL